MTPLWSKFHGGSHLITTFGAKFNVKIWPVSAFNVEKWPGESFFKLKNDPGSHFSTGSLFNVTPAKSDTDILSRNEVSLQNWSVIFIMFMTGGLHWCKIHLWRHSIVLALHYFQGMACYRSTTLLEVMDTRSFWIMFVFSRVVYLRSCISEVHSNNSCFSINKKKKIGGDSSSRTHAV